MIDRRFGENDPTMAPEDRMLERFMQEKQARLRNGDVFNLEDDDVELTHFGQSLGNLRELDQEDMLSDNGNSFLNPRKREVNGEDGSEGALATDEEPTRKKSRTEIMKEVIAKSKLHRYEQQKARDEHEDRLEKLDAQLGDIWPLLAGPRIVQPTSQISTAGDTGKVPLVEGVDKDEQNKQYDILVKEMLFDKRSQPADRTKTSGELASEQAEMLKKLEESRLKRMRGEVDSKVDSEEENATSDDEEVDYGFGKGILEDPMTKVPYQLNPDDLVDGNYQYDDDSIAVGSCAEHSDDYDSDASESIPRSNDDDEFDTEFLADVLPTKVDQQNKIVPRKGNTNDISKHDSLAFTYLCPGTHQEFLEILKGIPLEGLPAVIHRIRVLYSPKLAEGNKEKLASFSIVLLEHIIHIANNHSPLPFPVLETAIRHLHALTKHYPLNVSESFRTKLDELHQKLPKNVNAGDLLMLTAINMIYPTSDHFHPVVTPATLLMAKHLGQHPPMSLGEMCIGTFIITLLIRGQHLSKRVLPEAMNYILLALCLLSPVPLPPPLPGTFIYHEPPKPLRISNPPTSWIPRKLSFSELFSVSHSSDTSLALMHTLLSLLSKLADMYSGKSAFTPFFNPAKEIVSHLLSLSTPLPKHLIPILTSTLTTLNQHLAHACRTLRPLELHHHRPLPIPSHIPKFHEDYSLDKRSYDPNRQRVEFQKLKAEHKKERKGAIRELRKDAAFIGREKLREEKIASKEYHAKMARLTAMIQHEEGQGKNEYEKERKARKGRK